MPAALAAYRPSFVEKLLTAASIWALCLVTFSLPAREAPQQMGSLDVLALAKLAIRAGSLALFLFAWRWNPDRSGKQRILSLMAPAFAYLGWAFFSAMWSPLRVVTIGQALGLASLLGLCAWIALSCRTRPAAAFALNNVWWALLVYAAGLLAVHAVRPDLSGLDRELDIAGERGFVRPTVAGSTAGLGFLLTLLLAKTTPGFRPGLMFAPALVAHTALLYVANSRTAIAMTAIVSLVALVRLYPPRAHAKILTLSSAALCLYLLIDPGFISQEERLRASSEYMSRGQTQSELSGGSGRLELWRAILAQVELSPILGHGYFVTSEDGRLDVWDGPSNHTAHNLALQVLVSTGAVGCLLFAAAALRIA
ncbi:MAG: O-antigen ligase family protein, partial [Planctomycetota bacterium]